MALDPRIALMGTQWQAPDIQGALARGQEYRQNQMTMQAAQDTAARNVMLRELQGRTDFNDRNSVANYMRIAGAEGAPVVAAMTGADTMFNTRAAAARDATKFADERRVSMRDFLQREVGSFLNAPTDANIAASRARAIAQGIDAADFDAYAAPYVALPENERAARMRNDLGTTPEGRALVEMFADKYSYVNTGGAQTPVQMNTLALGATPPPVLEVTADPTKYTDIPTADGNITRVYADGRSEILRGPTGAPLAAAPTAAEESRRERREDRAAKKEDAALDALSKANLALYTIDLAMDSTNWTTAGVAGVFDWVPGSPPKRLAGYLNTIRANVAFNELQQMRRNSPTGGALGNVSDADMRLLQSTLATLDQLANPEDLQRALATIKRVTEAVRDAYAQDVRDFGVEAMGGSAPAPAPAGGGGSPQRIWDRYGVPHVIRGGQWVPE
jgi:hypothetical protein